MALLIPSFDTVPRTTDYGIATVDWTKWQVTLNTSASNLDWNNFTISNNAVTEHGAMGSGVIWNLTLVTPVTSLDPNSISVLNSGVPFNPAISVVTTVNPSYQAFIKSVATQIRNLIDTRLTEEDLPDSIIEGSVFLREAEMRALHAMGGTFPTTNSGIERLVIATMYYAAAILLYSNPQIVQQSFERSGIRFAEIDIDEKYTFLINFGNDIINPGPPGDPVGTVTVSELINRKLCW